MKCTAIKKSMKKFFLKRMNLYKKIVSKKKYFLELHYQIQIFNYAQGFNQKHISTTVRSKNSIEFIFKVKKKIRENRQNSKDNN